MALTIMNKLSATKIQHFKDLFLSRRKAILDSQHKPAEIDAGGDETDLIQANIVKNLLEKLSLRDQNNLKKINEALNRIEAGIFGQCDECEEFISVKRLDIVPESKLCVSCAENIEKYQKQFK